MLLKGGREEKVAFQVESGDGKRAVPDLEAVMVVRGSGLGFAANAHLEYPLLPCHFRFQSLSFSDRGRKGWGAVRS